MPQEMMDQPQAEMNTETIDDELDPEFL